MWNLCGDDIERAKEELNGRRTAIQARYDIEMTQLDTKIFELEAFERAARAFVVDFKNAAVVEAAVREAPPQAEAMAAQPAPIATAASEPATEEGIAGESGEGTPPQETERGRGENRSSRWRMRLATAETSA